MPVEEVNSTAHMGRIGSPGSHANAVRPSFSSGRGLQDDLMYNDFKRALKIAQQRQYEVPHYQSLLLVYCLTLAHSGSLPFIPGTWARRNDKIR